MSDYRLSVAFGSAKIIDRMVKRIAQHQAIRDDLVGKLRSAEGLKVRSTVATSYLLPRIDNLGISIIEFAKDLRHQTDVTVTSGIEFSSQFIDSFWINFSQNHKAVLDAIDRVIQVVKAYN